MIVNKFILLWLTNSFKKMDQFDPLVVDLGSGDIKAGFGGDDPRAVFPNVVSRRKGNRNKSSVLPMFFQNDTRVADDAFNWRGSYDIFDPMVRGKIVLWDDWEKVMRHTFYNELRVAPEEHSVVMAISPLFESLQVPSLYLENSAVFSLINCGKTDGLVLDCGYGKTHAVPLFDGVAQDDFTLKLELGGYDLTKYLAHFINERAKGAFFNTKRETVVDYFKVTYGRVSLDVSREISEGFKSIEYELPDETILHLGTEQILCTEPLFNPQLINIDQIGIHELIHESIRACKLESRKHLYENIVLVGGSSLFKGMKERIAKELEELVPHSVNIQIQMPSDRYTTWNGASMFSVLSDKQQKFVTLQQYEENGPHHPSNQ